MHQTGVPFGHNIAQEVILSYPEAILNILVGGGRVFERLGER